MNRNPSSSKPSSPKRRLLRIGMTGLTSLVAFGAAATGCLQRDVGPATPNTTNIFVDRLSVSVVDKIDLLFMIDNSISMADKQEILTLAVPELVNRLVDPICVTENEAGYDESCGDPSSDDGCSCGQPEFNAVNDIHIGIVTSSLGGHGGVVCTEAHGEQYWNPTQNDAGHLITRGGDGSTVATWNGVGFLSWDPENSARNPDVQIPGVQVKDELVASFRNLVTGAGEQGCGYEASLEAWYRFLIDPEPPLGVEVDGGVAVPVGIDDALLAQRAQFLRPDSLVAIIMLSDENDCSARDNEFGYFVSKSAEGEMPRSTSQCDVNPNDPCCLSCIQASYPSGCSDPLTDPKCAESVMQPREEDRLNLRCFNQKQRFGLDFLYPISRYVNGLSNYTVPMRDGSSAPNPLDSAPTRPEAGDYQSLVPRLDSSLVFLAGIIGVPWQDIATDDTLNDPTRLKYLTATEISNLGYWNDILGMPDGSPPVPAADPFMIESIEPRSGTNPRTGISIDPPSPGAGGNPINGHEYTILNNGDLQYACIFPLQQSKVCENVPPGVGCDCKATPEVVDRPLCDDLTQRYAKAYPGTRFLQVLHDYGANSIVASVCPKNAGGGNIATTDPSFGYNPAVAAIIDRLKEALQGACLPRELATDDEGQVLCQVIEVTRLPNPSQCLGAPGRGEVEPDVAQAILVRMRDLGLCGSDAAADCDQFSLCKLLPADDDENCLNAPDAEVTSYGYCYIDAMTDRNDDGQIQCQNPNDPDCLGNPDLVADCPAPQRRLLRLVSPSDADVPLPADNSTVFIACQGEAFRSDQ